MMPHIMLDGVISVMTSKDLINYLKYSYEYFKMDDNKNHILYFLLGIITTLLFCVCYTLKKDWYIPKQKNMNTFPKPDPDIPYDDL